MERIKSFREPSVRGGVQCSQSSKADMAVLRKEITGWARNRAVRTTFDLSEADRQELWECFNVLSEDEHGDHVKEITWRELSKAADVVLGTNKYKMSSLQEAVRAMDLNHNGKVSWFEFRAYMSDNWSASKTAESIMNHDAQEDMITIDGNMRLPDLVKHYRRRVIMEKVLKGQPPVVSKVKASQFEGDRDEAPSRKSSMCGHSARHSSMGRAEDDDEKRQHRRDDDSYYFDDGGQTLHDRCLSGTLLGREVSHSGDIFKSKSVPFEGDEHSHMWCPTSPQHRPSLRTSSTCDDSQDLDSRGMSPTPPAEGPLSPQHRRGRTGVSNLLPNAHSLKRGEGSVHRAALPVLSPNRRGPAACAPDSPSPPPRLSFYDSPCDSGPSTPHTPSPLSPGPRSPNKLPPSTPPPLPEGVRYGPSLSTPMGSSSSPPAPVANLRELSSISAPRFSTLPALAPGSAGSSTSVLAAVTQTVTSTFSSLFGKVGNLFSRPAAPPPPPPNPTWMSRMPSVHGGRKGSQVLPSIADGVPVKRLPSMTSKKEGGSVSFSRGADLSVVNGRSNNVFGHGGRIRA